MHCALRRTITTEYVTDVFLRGFPSELKRPSPEVIQKLKEVGAATACA